MSDRESVLLERITILGVALIIVAVIACGAASFVWIALGRWQHAHLRIARAVRAVDANWLACAGVLVLLFFQPIRRLIWALARRAGDRA